MFTRSGALKSGDPTPTYEETGDNPGWHTVSDEFYVRDVSGKEIAIYSGNSLVQWNIWGLDNVGKINSDTTRNYYLKDHLGSIRVVLNSTNQVISAQDGACPAQRQRDAGTHGAIRWRIVLITAPQ